MVSGATKWPTVDFEADPRFLLGVRAGDSFDGRRVNLHETTFPLLRSMCEEGQAVLLRATPRPYESFSALEKGEQYYKVDVDALPVRPDRSQPSGLDEVEEPATQIAGVINLVRTVDALAAVSSPAEFSALFYGVVWPCEGGRIGFIKKQNPRLALKSGRRWFDYGDLLTPADPPDLMMEDDFDLVVAPTFVAGLSASAMKDLFNDVGLALAAVPDNVKAIQQKLAGSVPLSESAAHALQTVGSEKVSIATRLKSLPERLDQVTITPKKIRAEMKRFTVPRSSILNAADEFEFDAQGAETFLDVVEARYFDDALGGEKRRADRYSSR